MLYVVTGPPAAGKSTWVREHAKHGDVTIDFDAIAATFTPDNGQSHSYPHHISEVAHAARYAAIDRALQVCSFVDVYIIYTTPSDKQMQRYDRLGANIVTIDPGRDVVLARCDKLRPVRMREVAESWYTNAAWIPI